MLFRDFGVWVWDFALVIYTISSDKSSIGFRVGALGFDIGFPVSGAVEIFKKRVGALGLYVFRVSGFRR